MTDDFEAEKDNERKKANLAALYLSGLITNKKRLGEIEKMIVEDPEFETEISFLYAFMGAAPEIRDRLETLFGEISGE